MLFSNGPNGPLPLGGYWHSTYRSVSNLPFLSKLLERVVNGQLVAYLTLNGLMPKDPSAYRKGHSTETADLRIFSDIVYAISNGKISLHCLLDLSAAFDTVDHDILVRRLECSCRLKGTVLAWLKNYLVGRVRSVIWGDLMSPSRQVLSGVPQGSVLSRYYLYYTLETLVVSSYRMGWTHTPMRMTFRSVPPALQLRPRSASNQS